MKIKFNLNDESKYLYIPLNKTIEIATMTVVVRAIFYECLYKLQII